MSISIEKLREMQDQLIREHREWTSEAKSPSAPTFRITPFPTFREEVTIAEDQARVKLLSQLIQEASKS